MGLSSWNADVSYGTMIPCPNSNDVNQGLAYDARKLGGSLLGGHLGGLALRSRIDAAVSGTGRYGEILCQVFTFRAWVKSRSRKSTSRAGAESPVRD